MTISFKNSLAIALIAIACSVTPAYAILDTARLAAGRVMDVALGWSDASPEVTKQVKDICEKMGVKHKVPVKKMSWLSKIFGMWPESGVKLEMGIPISTNVNSWLQALPGGYANSYALAPGLLDRLYVNEDWLKELSPAEVEFVLGHEIARIKHKDKLFVLGYNLLSAVIANRLVPVPNGSHIDDALAVIADTLEPNRISIRGKARGEAAVIADAAADGVPANFIELRAGGLRDILTWYEMVTYLGRVSINRQQVKAADNLAVKKLGATAAAIQFLNSRQQCSMKGPWYRTVQGAINTICYPIAYLPVIKYFAARPSNEERRDSLPLV